MQTVISAFNDQLTAQRAMERLIEAGFSRNDVHMQAGYGDNSDTDAASGTGSNRSLTSTSTSSSTDARGNRGQGGFFASVGDFFSDLFGADTSEEAGTYSEAVRRGNTVVVVDAANEVEAERAADIMDELGAIDINERASQWKSAGWSGFDSSAMPLSRDEMALERQPMVGNATQPLSAGQTPRQTGQTLNVVQEELQVGKRNVDRGGVRIVERVSEQPVHELVKLREERAVVERRPVDRVATAAELETFKDGTIEVRETSEEAVIAKTARVVEEVVVGKDVQERTETVNDTVRRKDVDVERFEGQSAASNRTSQEHAAASTKPGAGLKDPKYNVDSDLRNNPTGRKS